MPGLRYPSFAIVNRNRRACPIHEHLLACFVLLAQHHIELAAPTLIEFAKTAIAETVRIRLLVFLPQQLQCQMAVPLPLFVNLREVGQRFSAVLFCLRRITGLVDGKQSRFQPLFIPAFG
jgi:hypothetical protein